MEKVEEQYENQLIREFKEGKVERFDELVRMYTPVLYRFACGLLENRDDAEEVARRILNVFASDIEQNGTLHEYYHGDTGQPVLKPGFLNWNLLTFRLLPNIASGFDPTAF